MELRWPLIADGMCPVHQTPLEYDDDPRYDRCDDCPAGFAITSSSTHREGLPGVRIYQLPGREMPAIVSLPTTAVDVQLFTT